MQMGAEGLAGWQCLYQPVDFGVNAVVRNGVRHFVVVVEDQSKKRL